MNIGNFIGALDNTTILLLLAFTAIVATAALVTKKKKPKATFSTKRIVNQSELKLYFLLDQWRRENARDLILSTQVSYGAFISAKSIADWRSIASKHADYVFWAKDGYVRAIIESDGAGHYGDNQKVADKVRQRDTIKNAAAISANIPMIRIPSSASKNDITDALRTVLLPDAKPIVVKTPTDKVAHIKT